MLTVAEAITRAALERCESRGAHFREDFPAKDEGLAKSRMVIRKGDDGTMRIKRTAIPELPAELKEIIEKVNELFKGDLTDNDMLVYVNDVIIGKLLESKTLVKQAANNTKKQFSNSPDINTEVLNATINAMDAHQEMSSQVLGDKEVLKGLIDILLGPGNLYERLRDSA